MGSDDGLVNSSPAKLQPLRALLRVAWNLYRLGHKKTQDRHAYSCAAMALDRYALIFMLLIMLAMVVVCCPVGGFVAAMWLGHGPCARRSPVSAEQHEGKLGDGKLTEPLLVSGEF